MPPARREKPEPAANGHKRKLTVYIPEELAEQLRVHCFHHRLKYSAAVEQALTRLVKRA